MNLILLDTHVAIWSASGKLGGSSTKMIDAAASRGELLLSPISAWEIGMLVMKGRLGFGPPLQDFIRMLFDRFGVITATITPAIAAHAGALPATFHGDPADRVLVATAAAYGARLATRDRRILGYAKASKLISCVAC